MRRPSCFLLLPLTLGLLCGCSNGVDGALGQAAVSEGCAGSTLPCATTGDFNAPVAVGASVTLSVDLTLQGGGQPPLGLVSSNPGVFTVEEQTVTGVGPGIASLLFLSEENLVIDFVAIWVQQPSSLSVSRLSDAGDDLGEVTAPLGLLVGSSATLALSTLSSTEPLSGTPPATWTAADPSIVSVVDEGVLGRESLVGRAPGETTVTVSALGLQQTFTVEVTP